MPSNPPIDVNDEAVQCPYECKFPPGFSDFSLVTKGDAIQGAHNVYSGMIIGGELSNPFPTKGVVVNAHRGKSFVKTKGNLGNNYNFNNEGVTYGANLEDNMNYEWLEFLARNIQSSESGNFKVVVFTSGGTFSNNNLRNDMQGEDNGNTLAVFNTPDTVVLTKDKYDRQWGASVLAPFSRVEVKDDAGFVDGFVVAKEFVTTGGNANQLQLHGDSFKGDLVCPTDYCAPEVEVCEVSPADVRINVDADDEISKTHCSLPLSVD